MPIHLEGFAGEVPRTQPRYLPDQHASIALNTHLDRGHIAALHQPKLWTTLPAARSSIYLHGATWLAWETAGVSVVPGPVAQERLYIAVPGAAPKLRVAGSEYPLALPAPVSAPSLSIIGTPDPELQEVVAYARTWVTLYDEESQPSPISGTIDWSPGCQVSLTSMGNPPTGRMVNRQRIYRTQTTATGETDLFFVAEIAGTAVAYVHDAATDPLQEAINTTDFDPPPVGLTGLTAMPNGIMAGFHGKELMFSEPYKPHAWPAKYRQAVNDPIVGLCAFGTSLAVMTTGTPWVAQGLHPEAMSLERMEVPFPCVNAAGIADLGYAAIYPSTEGLVQVSTSGAQLISAPLWTREQWQAMEPATIIGSAWNGKYVFVARSPAGRRMGIVDLSGAEPGVSWVEHAPSALLTSIETGRLFMLQADRVSVVEFDAADQPKMAATWRSKPYVLPRPASFGAVMIDAEDAGPGDVVHIRADGAIKATVSVFNKVARIPAGKHRIWEVEVVGRASVTRIAIGQVPAEVAS